MSNSLPPLLELSARRHFVASGSWALRLALRTLQLPVGCRVATAAFACTKVGQAICQEGLQPLFLDLGAADHPTIAPAYDLAALPRHVGALVLVHHYGQLHPATERITKQASALGIALIHDAAASYGVDESALQSAAAILYSFGPQKSAAAAGGGLLLWPQAKINNYAPTLAPPKRRLAELAMARVVAQRQTRQDQLRTLRQRLAGLTHVEVLNAGDSGAPFRAVFYLQRGVQTFIEQAIARRWHWARLYDELPPNLQQLPNLKRWGPHLMEIDLSEADDSFLAVLERCGRRWRRRGSLWA